MNAFHQISKRLNQIQKMENKITLEDLKPAQGSTHKTKRVGRDSLPTHYYLFSCESHINTISIIFYKDLSSQIM